MAAVAPAAAAGVTVAARRPGRAAGGQQAGSRRVGRAAF
jgi:hypothetical protein